MSEKSIPYYDFVRKLFNRSGDPSKDFTHAILGVVTEIHEFMSATDEVNALEERGDLRFYVEALGQVISDHAGPFVFSPEALIVWSKTFASNCDDTGPAQVIAHECNELLDEAKRWVGYGKEPKALVATYHRVVSLIEFANDVGPYQVRGENRIIEANMAKLLVRYPGGDFDAFRAVVRDLESERVALQAS